MGRGGYSRGFFWIGGRGERWGDAMRKKGVSVFTSIGMINLRGQ